jgi:hypothetical protein
MRIRDAHATISGHKPEYYMPSDGLEIIADDGRTLFSVWLANDGVLRVKPGHHCKHNGKFLDDTFKIKPIATNLIELHRDECK